MSMPISPATPDEVARVLFAERRRAFGEGALEPLAEMPPDVQAAYRRFGAGVADRLGLARLAAERDWARAELERHRQALMQAIGAPGLPWQVLLNRTRIDYAALIRQRNDAQAAIAEEQRHDLAEAKAERDAARSAQERLADDMERLITEVKDERSSRAEYVRHVEAERDQARAELEEIRQRDETSGGVLYDVIGRAAVRALTPDEAVRAIERRLIQPLVAQRQEARAKASRGRRPAAAVSHAVAQHDAVALAEAVAERDAAREQVKAVRARHYGVCHGACGLDDACECEERDLVCAECNDRYPCPTRRATDGTGATDA